jgi:hypothetical protein
MPDSNPNPEPDPKIMPKPDPKKLNFGSKAQSKTFNIALVRQYILAP